MGLEAFLAGPLAADPVLMIVDDLKKALEDPRPDAQTTRVGEGCRAALGSILRAFARAPTSSRLLLTSRYDFRLPDGTGDAAEGLVRLHLTPMPERERTKQLRAAGGSPAWRRQGRTRGRRRCLVGRWRRRAAIRGCRRR